MDGGGYSNDSFGADGGYGQDHQGYEHNQYGAGGYHGGYPNHDNGAPAGGDQMAPANKSATGLLELLFQNIQTCQCNKGKPQHAHSRFAQDPHHHATMKHFHKVISEGLTDAHVESLVHIGTYLLAHLAKQSGMTAGHESEDEGEQDDGHAHAQAQAQAQAQ